MNHSKVENKKEIISIIRGTFIDDIILFSRYHLINGDVELAIKNTCDKVIDLIDNYGAEFYVLMDGDKTIGYINILRSYCVLHSFGLSINNRNKENKYYLINLASGFFDEKICSLLYEKNSRAISFLKNHGFEEIPELKTKDIEPPYENIILLIKYF